VVCTPDPSPPRRAPALTRRLPPACALAGLLTAAPAFADPPPTAAPAAPPAEAKPAPAAPPDPAEQLRALGHPVDTELRLFGSFELGRGFRFNNPFRLSTQLGQSAQSVSVTASYADLGLGLVFGAPDGLQHGGALHASFALAGVSQATITPSYVLAYRGSHPFMAYGRLGPSIIVSPDPSLGGEVAGGFAWFLTGKLAIAAEVVFDVYYGAGTYDVGIATYPILSGQLGLLFDHEFLP
jgi:hypothetical protein